MQKIKIEARSELAKALIETHSCPIMIVVKSAEGTLYKGILHNWVTQGANDDVSMDITLDDWDSYWGELAAHRYYL